MSIIARTDNTWWTPYFGTTWMGSAWSGNYGCTLFAITGGTNANWIAGFRPVKIRVNFTGPATLQLEFYDLAESLVADVISNYVSGTEISIANQTADVGFILFQTFGAGLTINSIEFDDGVTTTSTTTTTTAPPTTTTTSTTTTTTTLPIIPPDASPPPDRQDTTTPDQPGASGDWGTAGVPVVPAVTPLVPLYGVTNHVIKINNVNITTKVSACSITMAENQALATVQLDLPVGIAVTRLQSIVVTVNGTDHKFIVEEVSAEGPKRTVWGRAAACVLDAPYSAEISWNGWDRGSYNASSLANALAGIIPLTWSVSAYTLPSRWQVQGTPLACIQQLATAVGAIVESTPAGGLKVRKRWPVRPSSMSGATPVADVTLDTAFSISGKTEPGDGFGSVTVFGYDPSADLPDMELEESSPAQGSTVHVKMWWNSTSHPPFDSFVSAGSVAPAAGGSTLIESERVVFENGQASVRYPIATLHSYSWVGTDRGSIWRLTGGGSKEISMLDANGRGVADVTYTTEYERYALSGHDVPVLLFGVDVGEAAVAAEVQYSTGGSLAPALTNPLLGNEAACVLAGTAFLDDRRARTIVSASLPLTSADITPGDAVSVVDSAAGVDGIGKVSSVTLQLEPGKATRTVEVIL